MRLIDADRLIDTMAKELYSDKTFVEIMKEQPTVKAIPLDKVEQIRIKIEELQPRIDHGFRGFYNCQNEVITIIDKAINEAMR